MSLEKRSIFYEVTQRIFKRITSWILYLSGFRLIHKERLPRLCKKGIILCNHASFIDSIYIQCALGPMIVICGAKSKYFSSALKRFILKISNIIKVENEAQFLKDCSALLSDNKMILIYPEMGRNPEAMGEFKKAAAQVALESKAPVYPCYLYGTTKGQSKPCILVVGEMIEPKGTVEELTHHFKNVIQELSQEVVGR